MATYLVWPDTEGFYRSEEISSYLRKYIKTYAVNFEKIIKSSDSCIGINRNIKTALSLLKLDHESIEMNIFVIIESHAKKKKKNSKHLFNRWLVQYNQNVHKERTI